MDRFRNSVALLAHPFQSVERGGFDKIFMTAAVEKHGNSVVIKVNNSTPTAVNSQALAKKYNVPTLAEMREKQKYPHLMLISGGLHVWLSRPDKQDKIVLIQRDKDAKTHPLHWTSPAGRCGSHPDETGINEGYEELLPLIKRAGTFFYRPVAIAGKKYEGRSPLELRRKQVEARQTSLLAQGVSRRDIDADRLHLVRLRKMPFEEGLYRSVSLVINGKADKPFKAMPFFDSSNNTLEIQRSIEIKMHPGDRFSVVDGEPFNRKIGLYTLDELAAIRDKLAPSVRTYADHLLPR